jgi:hypothetical protein
VRRNRSHAFWPARDAPPIRCTPGYRRPAPEPGSLASRRPWMFGHVRKQPCCLVTHMTACHNAAYSVELPIR